MPKSVDKPLLKTLHSGYITEGPKVKEFEAKLAEFFGTKNVVTVNSGTSALTLALRLAGVGQGDEVVTTAMTCTATNLPILALGATPVFADVDPVSGLITPESVEAQITPKTKAIMCVDWAGEPCHLDELMLIAHKYGLKLVEDAAHALGATYKGRMVGTIADFTCFSLQAIKHITTVDGGIVTTKLAKDAKRGRVLRWFGIDREAPAKDTRIDQDILEYGYKFHMNDVAATIGIEQLKHLPKILKAHRDNEKYLEGRLITGGWLKKIPLPYDRKSSAWVFTVVIHDGKAEGFKKFMLGRGIQVSKVHRRNDEYSVFKRFRNRLSPGLDEFYSKMVCLPCHWGLSKADLDYIADCYIEFFGGPR